jgi:hypothetical protein
MRQILGGVVLLVVGAALCVWSVISPGISWDADGLNAPPRYYLGLGWVLAGVFVVVWEWRGGPRKR